MSLNDLGMGSSRLGVLSSLPPLSFIDLLHMTLFFVSISFNFQNRFWKLGSILFSFWFSSFKISNKDINFQGWISLF
jgi:hypothetical protein